jgi:NAD(P)H-dependent FMN reductase
VTALVGLPGSLRRGSYNAGLLRAAATLLPAGATLAVESLRGVPLYDGDEEEATGIPPRVAELKEAVQACDGLLVATPEYNNSLPGVLKNAVDWMSRPPADIPRVFRGLPVALLGATPGGFGTVLAQEAWLGVIRRLGMRPWFGDRVVVSRAAGLFDAEGALVDPATKDLLERFLDGFVGFVRAHGRAS